MKPSEPGEDRRGVKLLRTARVRADTTVIGANVAYPTDCGLLAKAVGKLVQACGRPLPAPRHWHGVEPPRCGSRGDVRPRREPPASVLRDLDGLISVHTVRD